MEEKSLTLEQLSAIREKAAALKSEKKLRKICPMVVFGDKECEEKEFYVAYMAEPTFPQFSKFMAGVEEGRGHGHAYACPRLFHRRGQRTRRQRLTVLVRPYGPAFGTYPDAPVDTGKLIDGAAVQDGQRIRQRLIYIRHYFPGVDLDAMSDEEFASLSEEALWLHEQFMVHNSARALFAPPAV